MTRHYVRAAALLGALLLPVQAPPLAAQEGLAPAPRGRVVDETELDRQTRELSAQLRCVVCQGVSLQDSPSQLAQEMRGIVREKLEEGMTPAEVRAYFVESYGEWVLLEPDPKGFNLLVYVMPVVMLLGGAGFVFFTARNWTRQSPAAELEELQAEEEEETVRY
jgi:cytochrome c-type biogenesis protein CcmH